MHVIGRGRYARATYPVGGQSSALAALTNRYLTSPVAPGTPSPFTVTAPTFHIVAAVNVTRRASGIFVVSAQMGATLAAADQQEWAAIALFGSVASGGVPNGQWLLDIGSTITTSVPTDAFPLTGSFIQSGAGNLSQSVILAGANAKPVTPGNSTIIIAGNTSGGTQITPGQFFGVVYELP